MAVRGLGRQDVPGDGQITVSDADSATLLIAAATSYKSFKDVTGDPEALTRAIAAASGRSPSTHYCKDHIAEHQRLFRRVALDLGTTAAAQRPTDERIRDSPTGERSATGGALFPVRPLSADHQLAAGRPAREPPGPVE